MSKKKVGDEERGEELARFILRKWPRTASDEDECGNLLASLAINAGCALAPRMLERGVDGVQDAIKDFMNIMVDSMEKCAQDMKQ